MTTTPRTASSRHPQHDSDSAQELHGQSGRRLELKQESPARNRCNAQWLRQQLLELSAFVNTLAPVDRDNALSNILSGVAWRGDE